MKKLTWWMVVMVVMFLLIPNGLKTFILILGFVCWKVSETKFLQLLRTRFLRLLSLISLDEQAFENFKRSLTNQDQAGE